MKAKVIKIRNLIFHILFLIVLFCVSVLIFGRMINQVTPDVAENMSFSTFPLVYMQKDGTNFNCLHGYANEMNTASIRDCITPLNSDRQLDIMVQAFSTTIDSISYEVTNLAGTEKLENTKVVKVRQDDDVLYATLEIQNKILMDQEYMLRIEVTSGGRKIYYYTHILLADGLHTQDYLNFVTGFYDKCVNKTDLGAIRSVVEPDEMTDAEGTLAVVDIHDSETQLTWGELKPQVYYKPIPKITEINRNTATVTMDYRIASVNPSGITEIFNVHEYYRLRFTDSRVFLLNLKRTTDEIFNPENNVIQKLGIRLGITNKNEVKYASDQKNRVVAFVQENELWTYDVYGDKLTQIFGFPQKENMDYRDFYDQNQIDILRVDTNGDVWFTVAGYMNRGSHEGENGVVLYHYETASAMVDEKIFLASMESPDMLMKDVDSLSYVSQNNEFYYVLLEEKIYKVSLKGLTYEVVAEGIHNNCHTASASGRFLCWSKEGSEYDSSELLVMDMESGTVRSVVCKEDEKIRPICFMEEDLIYGIAKTSQIDNRHQGKVLFPMYRIVIEDSEGNEVKNYQQEQTYVVSTEVSDYMLTLHRMVQAGGVLIETSDDHIMNTNTSDAVAVGVATITSDRKQTEVVLRVGDTLSGNKTQVVRSKIVTYETSKTLNIPVNYDKEKLYYVYAYGHFYKAFAIVSEAIVCADENVGVVIDSEQKYIWVRGDKSQTKEIRMELIPPVLLSGTMDMDTLAQETGMKVLDLTGCTLDQVLYFVSHDHPVIARTPDGPITIVGYDLYNTFHVDPKGTEWYYVGSDDAAEMFERCGNEFIVCM